MLLSPCSISLREGHQGIAIRGRNAHTSN
jgi:hypothetical protein